jgi:hypothetical protein
MVLDDLPSFSEHNQPVLYVNIPAPWVAYGCGFKMFSPRTYGDLAGKHGALGWFGSKKNRWRQRLRCCQHTDISAAINSVSQLLATKSLV